MPVPVVIYAAKSTQDKHRSIEGQIDDCYAKAEEEGWEVVGDPWQLKDEKFSAYSGNRGPGLERARALAVATAEERDEVCMLLVQAADRFARGAGDKPGAAEALIEVWHAMRRQNVHLRSVEDDGDLRDSPSVANLGHRAMMESRRKSGAVKKGFDRRAAKGLPMGSSALGLRLTPDGYEPVPSQVPTVERIFGELRAGKGQLAIARGLAREGIPTSRKGGRWHQGTVAKIARNPIYKGMIVHRGEVLPGAHDPLIPSKLWEEVNAQMDSSPQSKKLRGRGRPPIGNHLFRKGMLGCICGEPMLPRTSRQKLKNGEESLYEVYVCSGRARDVESCSMMPVKRADVDSSVYRYFEQVGLDVNATREQLADARDVRLAESRAMLAQALAEGQRAEESLTRIRRDYKLGKITADDWSELKPGLAGELDAAKAQVEHFTGQVAKVEAWGELQDAERDVLVKLTEIRQAMAGEIADAHGADAVRASLLRLFEGFRVLSPQPGERVHVDLLHRGRGLVMEPIPNEHAIEGYSDSMLPIFRREPLYSSENNYAASFAAAYLFGPIPIATESHT